MKITPSNLISSQINIAPEFQTCKLEKCSARSTVKQTLANIKGIDKLIISITVNLYSVHTQEKVLWVNFDTFCEIETSESMLNDQSDIKSYLTAIFADVDTYLQQKVEPQVIYPLGELIMEYEINGLVSDIFYELKKQDFYL